MSQSKSVRILLVDDDRMLVESMASWLNEIGFTAIGVCDVEAAWNALHEERFDLLLIDLRLGEDDGLLVISEIKSRYPDMVILAMTGYATPSTAIDAVNQGALDLLTKPLIDQELQLAIERAAEQRSISKQNEELRKQLDRRVGAEGVLSHDYRMLKIFDTIESVADAKASILITGENGTGKSMIARAIHNRSSRRSNPLIEVACGALPDTLLESELFGHVAGAFTGANHDKLGKFDAADQGTLFLDEIATASPAMQVKLLRVLQTFEFEPLGGTQTRKVDTRVILATNENLSVAVAKGDFRQDLFYRINVVNIVLPPLRERIGDLPLLIDHFIQESAETSGREVEGFDRDAIEKMESYHWPGNIRQLENVVERAVLLGRDKVLTVDDLPPELKGQKDTEINLMDAPEVSVSASQSEGRTLKEALEGPERQIILQSLRRHAWNRAATADSLDINRTTLYKKMKKLGLDDPRLQYQ
ncbi:MAG: sigma-54 dependent transcriptional regulator [Planctomycetota bacterium]